MSRNPVRRNPPAETPIPPTVDLKAQEFARNLWRAMRAKGWSQSDLARRAFGTTQDKRGYTVAKGRDRISMYLRGKQLPDERNLMKIAKTVSMTPEALAPGLHAAAIDHERPEIAINVAAGHPNKVHLVVNKIVTQEVAAKIFAMLGGSDDE